MASASKTPNLNLPQWVGTEKPERTDFNTANSDIDTAIGNRTYTEQNYVTDSESVTDSVDALDVGVAAHLAESASKHITESGSNANGSYVKYDDGTMICWASFTNSLAISTAQGSLFRSDSLVWTYPAAFVDSASVTGSLTGINSAVPLCGVTISNGLTSATLYFMSAVSDGTRSRRASLQAIGRWK